MAQPPRTRTRLARSERRDQIVDAAAEVVRSRDPGDVTFEAIADAAGVSRALLYNYFPDRQSLLDAVEDRHLADLARALGHAEPDGSTDHELVAGCVRAHLAVATGDQATYRMVSSRTSAAAGRERRVERALGPLSAGREPLVLTGALAAMQAMVLMALDEGTAGEPGTEALITAVVAGALADLPESVGP
jgi:AcrR family transcriptional regulator